MKNSSVEIQDRIEPLRGEWERLARRTESSPFLWPGWVSAWWNAFGEGELRILAAYQDGRLAGVLPLQWSHGVLSSRKTNENHPMLFGFLAANEMAAKQLLRALFSQGARRIELSSLDASGAGISLVRVAAEAMGYEVLAGTIQKTPYLAIGETTWDAYERRLRSRFRRELHRRRRRLEEKGRVTLEVFDGKERLEELLEEAFRVEGSGWKGTKGASINSSPAEHRFHSEVAYWVAEHGWLRLAFLRLDGRTLAFNYCLEYNNTYYMMKTGYDPGYGQYSPGSITRYLVLARAFSEGISTYELLGEFEPWKREWTDTYHELQSLHMFRREGWEQDSWYYQLHLAAQEIAELIPAGESFVLVDEDSWYIDTGGGRRAIPFPETWDGLYGGPPEDDETAIGELERQREAGANFVVFGWPAFWWLEYYAGLQRYLRSRYRCLAENERIVVFALHE